MSATLFCIPLCGVDDKIIFKHPKKQFWTWPKLSVYIKTTTHANLNKTQQMNVVEPKGSVVINEESTIKLKMLLKNNFS